MNIAIDLILIAIIITSAILAMRKGFIGTLFSLLGTIVSLVLSIVLSGPVSGFINKNFVEQPVKSYILSAIDSSAVGSKYDDAIEKIDVVGVVKSMPDNLRKTLEIAGVDVEYVVKKAEGITSDSKNAKEQLINSIASPISKTISSAISFVLLFIVLSVSLWFVAKLLTVVFNALPIAKSLNKWLGFAFGFLRGLLFAFVISLLFYAISKSVEPNSNNLFSDKTIDSTFVLKTISDFNPLNSVLK